MLASSSASVAAGVKSPEAFRTISEVSTDLDVPQHVLRFWEGRFTQIKPVKRAGGRRYYRPEDVDLLRGIRALLYREGFTIKGVQKVLRERGLRYVAELGRGDMKFESPSLHKLPEFIPVPEEPQFARAALAVLERAHPVPGDDEMSAVADAPAVELAEEERVKLEILLAELLQLKGRLRGALARSKG
ncbi:MAG: MerR family transcriptional regulator [Rhizomicrobium sp.]